MESQYALEKWEWTQEDFEKMGWHDCAIYALRFDDNVYLDIDYILKWNHNGDGNPFTFWIAPATLVFENPYYLKIDIELNFVNGVEIADVSKVENEKGDTIWNIETQEGAIVIGAETYKQVIRREPSFQFNQAIKSDERGDISFSLISEKDYKNSPEITQRKAYEFRSYLLALEKKELISKMNLLDKDKLKTKEYLIKKRKMQERILQIGQILNGTNF
jgi:hypothetical protein